MKIQSIRFLGLSFLFIGISYFCTTAKSRNEKKIDMSQFAKTALNIAYANNSNIYQTLDIIYPCLGEAPYKTIVIFHGGGWFEGNKDDADRVGCIFQATTQAYAVVSVNYRLSDEVVWPKPLHDAKAAIRFLRANGDKYLLDTKKIVVWGVSAGGHIVEMLAATNNQPEFEDFSMGNPNASSAVQGVIAWYAPVDLCSLPDEGMLFANKIMGFDVRANKNKMHNADPIELVNNNFPPILLVHGTNDKIVPYQQSVFMQKKVNEVTGKKIAELITFKEASHADAAIMTKESVANDLNFVDQILFEGYNPYRNSNYIEIKALN